jgi:acyl-CoA synthetase (AMP-forming)/AMP-acid ligase II
MQIHYTSLYLGIIGAGGCFTGANPGYTARELAHHLRMTGAKFLLTEIKTLDIAVAASEEVSIPLSNVFILNYRGEDVPNQHQSWETLLSHGEKDWVEVEDPDNTTAAYVSTSGTSGLPKAAIIPHSYLVSQAEFQERKMAPKQKVSAAVLNLNLSRSSHLDRSPTSSPSHHSTSSPCPSNMVCLYGEELHVTSCPDSRKPNSLTRSKITKSPKQSPSLRS